RYVPYPDDVMVDLIADIKAVVPGYVRISRVLRDIPANYIVGGLRDSLRTTVRRKLEEQGRDCRCIRCREYGHRVRNGCEVGEARLSREDYEASGGREIFLSYVDDKDTLFGLLRLRIQPDDVNRLGRNKGGTTALVRELHVYGPEVPLKEQNPESAQHRGLGKALLAEAERIAREEFHSPEIFVLSGVGARDYYRNESGYTLDGHYMVKPL
ncbi:MAG: GNAT family N-acetyltransferase, partial [Dehalococcoidales bacterium]